MASMTATKNATELASRDPCRKRQRFERAKPSATNIIGSFQAPQEGVRLGNRFMTACGQQRSAIRLPLKDGQLQFPARHGSPYRHCRSVKENHPSQTAEA
jgi:hypothetical protein